MAVLEITDQTFAQEVEASDAGTVVVDFWAPWCGPCRMIAPVLDEVAQELGDQIKIVKVNVDQNPETPGRFGVMGIPTLILFKNGKMVSKVTGYQPKEALLQWINEAK
ncbi:thioredoxin [Thermoflavimicrobium dichotomicum]|uniref:Thioredoxin n=1 Tax=Thermoflavimicrobium dichotomicum TaxID=46223 RepID=A0A1I3L6K7_9BACL|nr:thioredoxin [Thermoflavimicrobium dichotomicum]SFI80146.1 thioredoxin 1 [Thermoflavimicrobium dichotomicum]